MGSVEKNFKINPSMGIFMIFAIFALIFCIRMLLKYFILFLSVPAM